MATIPGTFHGGGPRYIKNPVSRGQAAAAGAISALAGGFKGYASTKLAQQQQQERALAASLPALIASQQAVVAQPGQTPAFNVGNMGFTTQASPLTGLKADQLHAESERLRAQALSLDPNITTYRGLGPTMMEEIGMINLNHSLSPTQKSAAIRDIISSGQEVSRGASSARMSTGTPDVRPTAAQGNSDMKKKVVMFDDADLATHAQAVGVTPEEVYHDLVRKYPHIKFTPEVEARYGNNI